MNRSFRNSDALARTKRSKEKYWVEKRVKDMINSYREMKMKKSKSDHIVNGIYMYYSK